MTRHLFLSFIIIFNGLTLYSQADTLMTQSVDELVIKAVRISTTIDKLPASAGVYVATEQQEIMQQNSLQEYVRKIPGVFTLNANNYAQDLRISIRGFGSRAAFGIRGIKLIVDGVPETTPDGQGQLDNLNLGIIKSIEVLQGPASSLYGNASGGVININTLDQIEKNYTQAGITIGSFGTQQYQLSQGLTSQNTIALLHGSYTQSNGYRVQSGYKNLNLNAKVKHSLTNKSSVTFNLNFADSPQADDPGGINLESVIADREQARDRNVSFKTGEEIRQFKTSLNYKLELSEVADISSYVFFATRDFLGFLPFGFGGVIDLSRKYGGHGSSYTLQSVTSFGVNKLQIGYDLAIQNDDRMRYFNNEGTQGEVTFDQGEQFFNAGIYLVDHFQAGNFNINGGLRFDINKLTAKDNFLSNGDNSATINLSSINPSLGLSYQIGNKNYVYTNYSTSFETPTLSELSNNPDGTEGFNPDLKPQQSSNIEVGLKGTLINGSDKGLTYAIAVFKVNTKNDLIPFELEAFPDRDFFRNAGETSRFGIESNLAYAFGDGWQSNLNYTYSNFKFEDYSLASADLNANFLPGIPKSFGAISLSRSGETGLLFDVQYILTGELFANDKNDVAVEGYGLLNLNLGYQIQTDEMKIIPHFGINNLTDITYNDNIRINAFGARHYEPAPSINFYGGLKINF